MRSGFRADRRRANWNIRSKRGLVYFSYAYATFFAMKHKTDELALIKVNIPRYKMPVIEPKDMNDFQHRLETGQIDFIRTYK